MSFDNGLSYIEMKIAITIVYFGISTWIKQVQQEGFKVLFTNPCF